MTILSLPNNASFNGVITSLWHKGVEILNNINKEDDTAWLVHYRNEFNESPTPFFVIRNKVLKELK